MRILFDTALVLQQNRKKCVKKKKKRILSLTLYWAKNAWSLSKSDPPSWVFVVSKQKSLKCDIVYTYFFLYDSQSRLSLYLWDSRHNTVLLLTLSLTSHNLPQSFKVTRECWLVSCWWLCFRLRVFCRQCDQCEVCHFKLDWRGPPSAFQLSHTDKHHAPVSYLPLYTWAPPSHPHLSVWVGATRPADVPGSGPHCL